ncbi:MAG: Gldg family protein [Phycisphaerae bacterium]|nr:Gldg family protein [Phycisphaerae bacterium]
MKPRILSAIVRRELASYFSSPTGYVFITIFIFLSAFAAFWLPDFFNRNIASLDQLNMWFPALLLLLVPAITMGAWAEERKQGTEELLLTLPARDWELVLGKYLACVLIYTAALLFSVSHVLVLAYLGKPDLGLMFSTYLGYWLAGASLIAVGLVASALTTNLTVAFITAAVLCGSIVSVGALAVIFPGSLVGRSASELSLPQRFADFGRGVIALENIAYFVMLALLGLWANTLLVSRHHWSGSRDAATRTALACVRGAAIVVSCAAVVTLFSRTTARADATAERLWSLSDETAKLIRDIPEDRPVLITAYVSPRVPAAYIQTRETLLGLLRELDQAQGGSRIIVKLVDTEPYTDAAREAKRNFNIEPRAVGTGPEDDQGAPAEIFMGLAFTSGGEQFVLPFLSRGLPVEYELARSIRTVSLSGRKKIGIVETEAGVFGSFDFNSFTSKPDWPIVGELRKQYEVVQVGKGTAPPDDLDVLFLAQPSTMTDADLAPILEYIKKGKPTIVFEDPLPLVNPGIATSEPRGAGQNPFQRQRMPQQDPKANLAPLWDLLSAEVPPTKVLWDGYNPRPGMGFEREIIFVARNSGSPQAFNPSLAMTSGLQELVVLMSGEVVTRPDASAKGLTVTPLMHTSPVSGFVVYQEMLRRGFFGIEGFNRNRKQVPSAGGHTIGAWIRGTLPPPAAGEGGEAPKPASSINVVLLPDLDLISPEFFRLRETGMEQFNFDNVTFILNVVDTMAGDESLVELRKRRPAYRTLERLDAARRTLEMDKDSAVDKAVNEANSEIAAANEVLRRKIAEIEERKDLDDTTRQIMIESVRTAEQRRVEVQTAGINDRKDEAITAARTRSKEQIEAIQTQIRVAAVALPPIPALALGTIVFVRRRGREREGVARERLRTHTATRV